MESTENTRKTIQRDAEQIQTVRRSSIWQPLLRDRFVLVAVCWLVLVTIAAIIGPEFLGEEAIAINLRARNTPPGSLENGWSGMIGLLAGYIGG
ncbi:MAG: hypothetical protein GY801_48200 [bacterium]|nr:hypothetical protein [bacterium]